MKPSIVNSTRQTQEDTGTPLTCTLGGETMEEVTRSDPNRQLPLPLSIQCHPEIPSWSQQGCRARYCYHWEVNVFLFFCFYLCVVLFGAGFVVVVGSVFLFLFFAVCFHCGAFYSKQSCYDVPFTPSQTP